MKEFRPLDALRHPLWWMSLAMLLCNDFWWKQASWMPNVLSGKISDFSGMLVFPLFLALLLGLSSRRSWFAVHALTAVLFAAIKLVPVMSYAVVSLFAKLGLSWQIWHDPTDLLALPMLALSFYLFPRLKPVFNAPKRAQAMRILAVSVAAFASLATGTVPAPRTLTTHDGSLMQSDLNLISASDKPISIQIERLNAQVEVDCKKPVTADLFTDDQFKSQGTWTQMPGEASSLIPIAIRKTHEPKCLVVKLTVDRSESVLVAWDADELPIREVPIEFQMPVTPENAPENSLLIFHQDDQYFYIAKGQFSLSHWKRRKYASDYWK